MQTFFVRNLLLYMFLASSTITQNNLFLGRQSQSPEVHGEEEDYVERSVQDLSVKKKEEKGEKTGKEYFNRE